MPDGEIVKRVLAGDRDAFSLLVRKYQAMVHGVLFNATRNTAITEDLAQEVFLEAYSKLITLREPARFGGWLRSIAYNQGRNWHNRQRGRLLLVEDEAELKNELGSPAEPSKRLENEERLKALLSVLDSLSESNRLIITLKYLEGLSNNEIAEFLEIPAPTLNVRIHRAINQLRDRTLNALTQGFKDERLGDDFVESVRQRIAEYKRVVGVGVHFYFPHDERLPSECPCVSLAEALAQRYEGTCYHLPDGNLVILYGYPETHEDDAVRAALTAEMIVAKPHPDGKVGIAISACLSISPPSESSKYSLRSSASHSLMALASAVEDGILVDETAQFLLKEHYQFEQITVRSQARNEMMEELNLMHPILAASYLMCYSQKPLEEAVEGLKLFIRNIDSLDEHIEYWAYALENINGERLKRMFKILIERLVSLPGAKQADSLSWEQVINLPAEDAANLLKLEPSVSMLEVKRTLTLLKLTPWLFATLYERESRVCCQLARESKETEKHLARLGIIAEPCWAVLGPFDGNNFDADFESRLLKAVFNVGRVWPKPTRQEAAELAEFPWREANDNLIDGYIDCVKVMNSIDKVYGYVLTVIDSPSERPIQIRLGYDDYVTVWLNGEKLLERTGGSPCIYDDIAIDATLQSGQNHLLVKIGNIEPGWGFLIRITDANGVAFDDLSYASPQIEIQISTAK